MMYYVFVRGTPGQAGVDVEGLDSSHHIENYTSTLDALGFLVGEGGVITKKPGSHGNIDTVTGSTRILLLQPYLFASDVLVILREAGYKVISSAGVTTPPGAVVWTLEKH
ncbi:hypothetical protein Pcinc_008938 [Petrolisthes cinctipes]|uniref:Uncharacterized protein n=1 Tax=Petrolisthes cinctipes TaxID=88211 RepID=A0AAE1KVZ5_PETCI|nr:hypothetical protein Pcinc_008938 [Petrolisthes cinctipes]